MSNQQVANDASVEQNQLRISTQLETLKLQRNAALDSVTGLQAELAVERNNVKVLAAGYEGLRQQLEQQTPKIQEMIDLLDAEKRETSRLTGEAIELRAELAVAKSFDEQAFRTALRNKVCKHLADVYGLPSEELPAELFE